ncbi:hypothetical protein D3C84_915590 [compost metagenome]
MEATSCGRLAEGISEWRVGKASIPTGGDLELYTYATQIGFVDISEPWNEYAVDRGRFNNVVRS